MSKNTKNTVVVGKVKEMTEVEFLQEVLALNECKANPSLVDKGTKMLNSRLNKKKKSDPKAKENALIAQAIIDHFTQDNTPITATELWETGKFAGFNKEAPINKQRVNAQLDKLVKDPQCTMQRKVFRNAPLFSL